MRIIKTLIIVITIGFLILIHELGHYAACRVTGVGVSKFTVGFFTASSVEIDNTEFAIGWLPLGGYNRSLSSYDKRLLEKSGELEALKTSNPGKYEFITNESLWWESASPGSKFLIASGGPFVSILFGIFAIYLARPFLTVDSQGWKRRSGHIKTTRKELSFAWSHCNSILHHYAKTFPLTFFLVVKEGVSHWINVFSLPFALIYFLLRPKPKTPPEAGLKLKEVEAKASTDNDDAPKSKEAELKDLRAQVEAKAATLEPGEAAHILELMDTLEALEERTSKGDLESSSQQRFRGPIGMWRGLLNKRLTSPTVLLMEAGMLSLGIGVLMLIPLPPLDGSKMLFSVVEGICLLVAPNLTPQFHIVESILSLIGLAIFFGFFVNVTANDMTSPKVKR